jgi:hypothetical protein
LATHQASSVSFLYLCSQIRLRLVSCHPSYFAHGTYSLNAIKWLNPKKPSPRRKKKNSKQKRKKKN